MMKEKNMYRPLPESLTIKTSKVDGLGLFAKKKIKKGEELGITHIKIGQRLFRTPLGGFINHSDFPNCIKAMTRISNVDDTFVKMDYKIWKLFTLNDIKKDAELTITYTFYKV